MMGDKRQYVVVIGILFAIISTFFISGCQQTFTCNKPYILVGNNCCLDQNNNSICDKDETPIQSENYYYATDIESARDVCALRCSANDANFFCTHEFNIRKVDKNSQLTGEIAPLKCQDDVLNMGLTECQKVKLNKASCT